MAKRTISYIELEKYVRQGLGVSQIARKLNVTKGAVSKALKRMEIGISKDVALRTAPQLADKKIDAMDQLQGINSSIRKELRYLEEQIDSAEHKDRIALQNQKLRHTAEIRKQIGLLLTIVSTMYNVEEIQAFTRIVMEEIGYASPEIKQRILERLNAARALRSTLHLNSTGVPAI